MVGLGVVVTVLLVGAAVVATLVVTGDDDDDTLAADEFQERTGSACSAFFGELLPEAFDVIDPVTGEPEPGTEEAFGERVIERGDELMAELRSIGAPDGQGDEWNEWIGLMQESIDDWRTDPASFAEESNPERGDRIDELSQELGVPECTGDELPESVETRAGFAALLAEVIQADSDGLITEAEAECMGEGFADEFTLAELAELDEAGVEIEDLPADRQAAIVDIVTRCLPAEKLIEFGQLGS